MDDESNFSAQRRAMVEQQIARRGISDTRVLRAMTAVPRHEFVPLPVRPQAYEDRALSIGYEQTISQPYIVAFMSETAALPANARVLEIGTGSGYQAAILAEMGCDVYSMEIIPALADRAAEVLRRLGYNRVQVYERDAFDGLPEYAPYDAIICAAAPETIPPSFLTQLAVGGKLVIPVGRNSQQLTVVTREPTGFTSREVLPVRFVPMTGQARRDSI